MMTCWHADPVLTCQEVKSGVPVVEQEQLTNVVIKMSQASISDIPSRLGKEEQGITFLFTLFPSIGRAFASYCRSSDGIAGLPKEISPL